MRFFFSRLPKLSYDLRSLDTSGHVCPITRHTIRSAQLPMTRTWSRHKTQRLSNWKAATMAAGDRNSGARPGFAPRETLDHSSSSFSLSFCKQKRGRTGRQNINIKRVRWDSVSTKLTLAMTNKGHSCLYIGGSCLGEGLEQYRVFRVKVAVDEEIPDLIYSTCRWHKWKKKTRCKDPKAKSQKPKAHALRKNALSKCSLKMYSQKTK